MSLEVLDYLQIVKLIKLHCSMSSFPSFEMKFITLLVYGITIESGLRKSRDLIFQLGSQLFFTSHHQMELPIMHQFLILILLTCFMRRITKCVGG